MNSMNDEMIVAMLMFLFAGGFAIILGILIGKAVKKEQNIHENGIETDGIVVDCKSYLANGKTVSVTRHTTIVEFTGNDGKRHQCKLNYSGKMPVGRKMRIKYLPGKYDYIVFVSQEI